MRRVHRMDWTRRGARHLTRRLLSYRRRWQPRTTCGRSSSCSHNLIILLLFKICKLRRLATRVFPVYLDKTGNEELLFLVRLSMPEVWFAECHLKTCVASPIAVVWASLGASVRFNAREVVEIPRFSDRKRSISVFF